MWEVHINGGRVPDIATAEASIAAAQAKLREIVDGGNDADVAKAVADVESARAALSSSREKLDQLVSGGAPAEQAAADAAIQAAQGGLDQALAKREALRNPPADELASARRSMQNAESSLTSAQDATSPARPPGSKRPAISRARSAVASVLPSSTTMIS